LKKLTCVATVALALVILGCGGDETAETVTQERTIVEKAPPPETVTVKSKRPPPKPVAAKSDTVTVPDVVGENHQYAQDTMQAAGLYSLDERDATGQDRLLLWDRNWVVVSQDPPAGSEVPEDTTITLSAKKEGE
jgi:beta-lactam-binding protein with PASTA domain